MQATRDMSSGAAPPRRFANAAFGITNNPRIRGWQWSGALVAAMTTTPLAQAEVTRGRFQLGLEGTLFASERGTIESSSGAELDYSASNVGITAGQGLVFGYGVSEAVVLGARVSQATQTFTLDDSSAASEDRLSTFDLLPRVEVLLGSTTPRLFLFGTAGYRSMVTETTAELSDPTLGTVSSRTRLKSTGLSFGAGIGLHGFVGDHVSLDTSLGLLRTSGDSQSGGDKGNFTNTAVVLTVGISAWLGGKASPAAKAVASSIEEAERVEPPLEEDAETQRRTVVSSFGTLTRNTQLENTTELRIVANPTQDAEHIFLRFSLLGMPPPDLTSWMGCTTGNVLADDELVPLDNVVVEIPGDKPTVRARATVKSVIQLARARELAAFEVCSDRNHLGDEAQRALLEFLEAFKKSAEGAGTWRPEVIAPANEPNERVEGNNKGAPLDGAGEKPAVP